MASTLLGIIVIIIASYLYDSDLYSGNIHTPTLLMLIGLLFQALQRVYEEYLILKIETSTYRFVGLEGFFGLFFVLLFQFFFTLALVGSKEGSDSYNFLSHINPGKSTALLGTSKFNLGPNLIIITIILLLSITVYEFSGMTITRKVSSTFRVVIEIIKVIFVWIFEICYYDIKTLTKDQTKSYIGILLLKLLGYIFIIFGNILVNEIVGIRFCGLDKYYGKGLT
jgi:hypothetical protein